tara:strand:+ start:75 stop:743 length:669 start_codon:yes stop_codon:yes gene_type:complete
MRKFKNRKSIELKLNENNFSILDVVIWVCLSMVVLMLCTTSANAQITTYGCTDSLASNYNPNVNLSNPSSCVFFDASEVTFYGFNTTAIASIKTPTIDTFNPSKLIVRYKRVGDNSWTKIKLKIDEETFKQSGRIDTLGVSFWYFQSRVGTNASNTQIDGGRYNVFVRLNNLDTDTDYKVKMKFKGQSLVGGANKTSNKSATDNTKSFMYEAAYTNHLVQYN